MEDKTISASACKTILCGRMGKVKDQRPEHFNWIAGVVDGAIPVLNVLTATQETQLLALIDDVATADTESKFVDSMDVLMDCVVNIANT